MDCDWCMFSFGVSDFVFIFDGLGVRCDDLVLDFFVVVVG